MTDSKTYLGQVSWYSLHKGFGFVQIKDLNSDAFLHLATLEEFGHLHVKEGDNLKCVVNSTPKGYQITKILEITPRQGASLFDENNPDSTKFKTANGSVRWFNPVKGYGFIRTEYGDAFLHISVLRKINMDHISAGTKVIVKLQPNGKKFEAVDVLLEENSV